MVRMRWVLNGEGDSGDSFGMWLGAGQVQGDELLGVRGRWMELEKEPLVPRAAMWLFE